MPTLTFSHWLSIHGLITLGAILVYVVTSHVLHQRRHPSAAIGWVLFMLLLPYAALPLFLLVGTRKLVRSSRSQSTVVQSHQEKTAWPSEVAITLGQPPPSRYQALRIHDDGPQALQALLEIIDGSQHTLDICTFILGRDAIGEAVLSHLAARARAGVRVRLLLDGVGRIPGRWSDVSELRRAGGQIGLFMPLLPSLSKGRANLRIHRKLALADAGHQVERMWCGGRNLTTDYFEGRPGHPGWRDLSFDLQGPLVQQAADVFEHDWTLAVGPRVSTHKILPFAVTAPHTGVEPYAASQPVAQIIASGPDQADDTVYAMLISAAYRANTRIAIVSPYVVLDDALLMALCMAARRGVQVDLLLPARSNHRLADIARHRSLRMLASAGVHIWLAPHMLHAKMAVIDNVLALVGSTNLDGRSLFLNYELMVAFLDASDIARYTAWFERELCTAHSYLAKPAGLLSDFGEGLILWIAFQL